jgi:diacylglycerol kinase family enzyme
VALAASSADCVSRITMSMITMAVTVSMTVMCQFAVLQTWLCLATPIGPVDRSRGRPLHQSQNPVRAVGSEITAPAMMAMDPAAKKSCATLAFPSPIASDAATNETTSQNAASTYMAIGKSVSGGCAGLPFHPRRPRNLRPRNEIAGLIEYSRGTGTPAFHLRPPTPAGRSNRFVSSAGSSRRRAKRRDEVGGRRPAAESSGPAGTADTIRSVSFLLVANPSSGSGGGDLAVRAARELDDVRTLELREGIDLRDGVMRGLEEGRTLVACGGDGTINAVAQHVAGTEGVLGVLPAGTLNHFARDLGLDDPLDALDALATGRVARVDVGRGGDRIFVNTMSLGLYPELVRERERREDRLAKWSALALSMGFTLARFRPVEGSIAADGDRRELAAAIVFIGNNRFSTSPGSIGSRERLDEGVLDVRIVPAPAGLRGRSRFAWAIARAHPFNGRVVRTTAKQVEMRLRGGPRAVAFDGEGGEQLEEARATIEPGALRVLVPASAEARTKRS